MSSTRAMINRAIATIAITCFAIGCGGETEPASPGGTNSTTPKNNSMMTTPNNATPGNMVSPNATPNNSTSPSNMTSPTNMIPGMDMGGAADMASKDMAPDMNAPEDMGMTTPPDMGTVDMAPQCGNGVVEGDETCDGDCSVDCDDNNACTMDTHSGQPMMCDVVCSNVEVISSCGPADGCCPTGCMVGDDPDCVVDCKDPATWPTAWTDLENQVIAEVNMRRAAGGTCENMMSYPPMTAALVLAPELREAGRCHALDMATRDYFGSASPEGEKVGDRVQATGYSYASVGQDTGAGRDAAKDQVDAWMMRAGSCKHILDPVYEEIGLGYAFSESSMYKHYWVQVIADKPSP